jgi:hypothetical protein
LPRDEIVVMTKLCGAVSRDAQEALYGRTDLDSSGYVNQYGLSRKVCIFSKFYPLHVLTPCGT